MSRDIHAGRWLQLKGKAKRAWGQLVGDESAAAEGNAEVIAGTLQESVGVAKREALRGVSEGIDAFAKLAKKTARSLVR
jgi:uncharacterized protein YjbJ (UPF0337 family)